MRTTPRVLFLVAIVLLGICVPLSAQPLGTRDEPLIVLPATSPAPTTYGSASTVYAIAAVELRPPNSAITYGTLAGPMGVGLYQTTDTLVDWFQPVRLPSGASVTRVEMVGCDTSASGQLLFIASKATYPPGTNESITPLGATGLAETPGCGIFGVDATPPATIQNGTDIMYIAVGWRGAFDGSTWVYAFRVYYTLQVSPAPTAATFPVDVPTTSPYFRFVEALAASGITAGCGDGMYCPNSPVTRAQMAVFLSVALGLHWSP